MYKFFFWLALGSAIAVTGGCNAYKTFSYDYDHGVDFTKYKTYAWVNDTQTHLPTPYDNEIIDNNIKNYVDQEMSARNYSPEINQPDLLFELMVNAQKKVSSTVVPVEAYPIYPPFPRNSYRYYDPPNYRWNRNRYYDFGYQRGPYQIGSRVVKTVYERSTISLHVFERVTNRLIWTGTAEGDVYDPAYMKHDMHPAVIKILKQYPIKKNKQ